MRRAKNILDKLTERPLVWDGAMGTMIYARGVFINSCYDELCQARPDLIKQLHAEYVSAGADVIETNTFGANAIKLREHGLLNQVEAINRLGAELARNARAEDTYVAGSVGPCLKAGQMLNDSNRNEVCTAFAQQIQALTEGGVDFIQLETFVHLDELELAAALARESGLAVAASFTTRSGDETALGGSVEAMALALEQNPNIDIIGINCGVGPSLACEAIEKIIPGISKPCVVMPNAGMPKQVGGRMIYMSSPEYFTEFAKRFIEIGARGIGGCCGTTPEHIRVAAKAVKSLSGVRQHVAIHSYEPEGIEDVAVMAPADKSRFAQRIFAGEKVTSVELLPPKSCDIDSLIAKSRLCQEHGINAINIPDGPRASARVSPMIAAAAILNQAGIEPVLHYCCCDRNLIGMQSDLLGAQVAGIRNVLIITGDPPKLGDYPDATGVFDVDAVGLTQVAANLNRGRDVGGNPVDPPTSIFIGVGASPCAVSREREINRYFLKINAGAEFVMTQPVFDADALLRFLDQVETREKQIPVVAGVWPLVSYKNAEFLRNEVPGLEVPDDIMERMSRCHTREAGVEMGIAISREIIARISPRVAGFQVNAPFGRVEIALRVLGRM